VPKEHPASSPYSGRIALYFAAHVSSFADYNINHAARGGFVESSDAFGKKKTSVGELGDVVRNVCVSLVRDIN
jgi:hypothetical protein